MSLRAPAFWDLHLHGAAGVDFMHAGRDEIVFSCEKLGRNGTGFFAPTLLTAEPKLLHAACVRWGMFFSGAGGTPRALARFLPKGAALPIGLHLEGPFLNPAMAGAHPRKNLLRPSLEGSKALLGAAQGHIAIVTLAPELPGALPLVRWLKSQGIRVQLGHSMATSAQALAAVRAGAEGITHLFNAMRAHHRAPGLLAPLARRLVTAELITDGLHLDPVFLRWCYQAAGHSLYAVSDGCSAMGAPAKARLTLGSLRLRRQGKAAVVAGAGTLAGGATYLSSHPAVLSENSVCPSHSRTLAFFYKTQSKLFPKWNTLGARPNHFHPKTLRFLGC